MQPFKPPDKDPLSRTFGQVQIDPARAPYPRQYPVRKLLFLGLHFGFLCPDIWAANREKENSVVKFGAKAKALTI